MMDLMRIWIVVWKSFSFKHKTMQIQTQINFLFFGFVLFVLKIIGYQISWYLILTVAFFDWIILAVLLVIVGISSAVMFLYTAIYDIFN
jgi:hypothetical protein